MTRLCNISSLLKGYLTISRVLSGTSEFNFTRKPCTLQKEYQPLQLSINIHSRVYCFYELTYLTGYIFYDMMDLILYDLVIRLQTQVFLVLKYYHSSTYNTINSYTAFVLYSKWLCSQVFKNTCTVLSARHTHTCQNSITYIIHLQGVGIQGWATLPQPLKEGHSFLIPSSGIAWYTGEC